MKKVKGKGKTITKIFIIVMAVVVFIMLSMAVLSTVPVGSLEWLQNKLDAVWWLVSTIRWIIIYGIILWLPKLFKYKENKIQERGERLYQDYQKAEKQGATYETLQEYEATLLDLDKMKSVYQILQEKYKYVIALLVGIELFAVQLPHLL